MDEILVAHHRFALDCSLGPSRVFARLGFLHRRHASSLTPRTPEACLSVDQLRQLRKEFACEIALLEPILEMPTLQTHALPATDSAKSKIAAK